MDANFTTNALKVLIIIVVIAGATIGGIEVYNFEQTNSVPPVLTIDSLTLTPGLAQNPIAVGIFSDYNFSYTVHAQVTLTLKTPKTTVTAGVGPCAIGIGVTSLYWYQVPIVYNCPAIISQTIKAGTYHTSIIGEIMSNSSLAKYPSTLSIKVGSEDFNATSQPISLALTSHGVQYMYLYNATLDASKPIINGSSSYFVNASFYYMSDQAMTISSCSNFNLIVNTTGTGAIYPAFTNLWSLEPLSCSPSHSITLEPGGVIFNISARLVNPNGSIYFNIQNAPSATGQLPLQVTNNKTNVLSNIYDI